MLVPTEKLQKIVEKELEFMSEEDLRDYYRDLRLHELQLKTKKEIAVLYQQVMGYGTPDPTE